MIALKFLHYNLLLEECSLNFQMTKKEHQPVSSIDRTASVGSPSSSALGPPAPPLRSFAREQQRLVRRRMVNIYDLAPSTVILDGFSRHSDQYA